MSDRGITSSKGVEKSRGRVGGIACRKTLKPRIMYNEQMLTGKTAPINQYIKNK